MEWYIFIEDTYFIMDEETFTIDHLQAGFTVPFITENERGYVSINTDMYRDIKGLVPTGKFCIYMLHPWAGSSYFKVEKRENDKWVALNAPAYVTEETINWIGDKITSNLR
jgi:hypothetical protein